MKGQSVLCANPYCGKEFVKRRIDQKCCGNPSCRSAYHKIKKGEMVHPYDYRVKKDSLIPSVSQTRAYQNDGSHLLQNTVDAVVGIAAPAVAQKVGGVPGAIGLGVFRHALLPFFHHVAKHGFTFRKIENEKERLELEIEHWKRQRGEALKGRIPYRSILMGIAGVVVGFQGGKAVKKRDNKGKVTGDFSTVAATVGGGAMLLAGAAADYQEHLERMAAKDRIVEQADLNIAECNRRLALANEREGVIEGFIGADYLVPNKDGVYYPAKEVMDKFMTAEQFISEKIETIEFREDFKYLLGSPGRNFYFIVTGEPGNGKSTFALKFAAYFQKNHGNVAYLAAEQPGKDSDMQGLINRLGVDGKMKFPKDPSFYNYKSLDELVESLKPFSLVVLDSVNRMKLKPEDIEKLREKLPNTGIMAIMQSTKDGNFKGSQEYKHDCNAFLRAKNMRVFQEKSRSSEKADLSIEELVM